MAQEAKGVADLILADGQALEYRGNVHEELKLVLVRGSGFTVRRRGTAFHAAPGQLVALHAEDAHSGDPDVPGETQWMIMCVPPSLVAEVAPKARLVFRDPLVRDGALARRFGSLYEALARPGPALGQESGTLALISALARLSDEEAATSVPSRDDAAVDLLRDYLEANLARNVTLDELSAVTGRSKYPLVHACTARYGLPPHRLHLALRLDRARELLRRGVTIGEVAYETGFHDQPHLTRMFARSYGVTPAVYRSFYVGTSPKGRAIPRRLGREYV